MHEIPAGLLIGPGTGAPLRFARALRPDPAHFAVVVEAAGGRLTDPAVDDLAAAVRADPRWRRDPVPVLLVGSGLAVGGVDSSAARLVARLGVPVHAAVQTVWTGLSGELFVSPVVGTRGGGFRPRRFGGGTLVTFRPQGTDRVRRPVTVRRWRDQELLPWRGTGPRAPGTPLRSRTEVPAGVVLGGSAADVGAARRVAGTDGWYSVFTHRRPPVGELAGVLRDAGWNGVDAVQLVSCRTPAAEAQALADELGVPVRASDGVVFTGADGVLYASDAEADLTGRWHPRGTGVRDLVTHQPAVPVPGARRAPAPPARHDPAAEVHGWSDGPGVPDGLITAAAALGRRVLPAQPGPGSLAHALVMTPDHELSSTSLDVRNRLAVVASDLVAAPGDYEVPPEGLLDALAAVSADRFALSEAVRHGPLTGALAAAVPLLVQYVVRRPVTVLEEGGPAPGRGVLPPRHVVLVRVGETYHPTRPLALDVRSTAPGAGPAPRRTLDAAERAALPDDLRHLARHIGRAGAGWVFLRTQGEPASRLWELPVDPAVVLVDAHGSPESISVGRERVSPERFARLLRALPGWRADATVLLAACEVAREPGGTAHRLATALRQDVVGANRIAYQLSFPQVLRASGGRLGALGLQSDGSRGDHESRDPDRGRGEPPGFVLHRWEGGDAPVRVPLGVNALTLPFAVRTADAPRPAPLEGDHARMWRELGKDPATMEAHPHYDAVSWVGSALLAHDVATRVRVAADVLGGATPREWVAADPGRALRHLVERAAAAAADGVQVVRPGDPLPAPGDLAAAARFRAELARRHPGGVRQVRLYVDAGSRGPAADLRVAAGVDVVAALGALGPHVHDDGTVSIGVTHHGALVQQPWSVWSAVTAADGRTTALPVVSFGATGTAPAHRDADPVFGPLVSVEALRPHLGDARTTFAAPAEVRPPGAAPLWTTETPPDGSRLDGPEPPVRAVRVNAGVLLDGSAADLRAARRVATRPGWFTVLTHDAVRRVPRAERARLLRGSGWDGRTPVLLVSCLAGRGGVRSTAQELADDLGVLVAASDGVVFTGAEGALFVAEAALGPNGRWVPRGPGRRGLETFRPARPGADVRVDQAAPAVRDEPPGTRVDGWAPDRHSADGFSADRILAASVPTPSGLLLPGDPAAAGSSRAAADLAAVGRFGADPRFFDLHAHGAGGRVLVEGRPVPLDVLEEVVRRSGAWRPGTPVRLLVCEAAAVPADGGEPVSVGLGARLGVPVGAPERFVFTGAGGLLFEAAGVAGLGGTIRPDHATASGLRWTAPPVTRAPAPAPRSGPVDLDAEPLTAWPIGGGESFGGTATLHTGLGPGHRPIGHHRPQGRVLPDRPAAPPVFFGELGRLGHSGLVGRVRRPGAGPHPTGPQLAEAALHLVREAVEAASPQLWRRVGADLALRLAALDAETTEGGTRPAAFLAGLLERTQVTAGSDGSAVVVDLAVTTTPDGRRAARPRPASEDTALLDERYTAWQTHADGAATTSGTGTELGARLQLHADVAAPVGAGPVLVTAEAGPSFRRGRSTERTVGATGSRTSVRRVVGAGRLTWFTVAARLEMTVRLPGGRDERTALPTLPVELVVGFPDEQSWTEAPAQLPAVPEQWAPGSRSDRRRSGLLAETGAAVEAADLSELRDEVLRRLPWDAVLPGGWLGEQVHRVLSEPETIGFADDVFGGGHSSTPLPLAGGGTVTLTTTAVGLSAPERVSGSGRSRVVRMDRRLQLRGHESALRAVTTGVGARLGAGVTLAEVSSTRLLRVRLRGDVAHDQESGRGTGDVTQVHNKRYLQYDGPIAEFRAVARLAVRIDSSDPRLRGDVTGDVPLFLVVAEPDVEAFLARAAAPESAFPAPVPAPPGRRTTAPPALANRVGVGTGVIDQLAGAQDVLPAALALVRRMHPFTEQQLTLIGSRLESPLTLGGMSARQESLLTRTGVLASATVDDVRVDVWVSFRPAAFVHTGHRDGYTVENENEQWDSHVATRQWLDTLGLTVAADVRLPYAGIRAELGRSGATGRSTSRGYWTGNNVGLTYGQRMQLFAARGAWRITATTTAAVPRVGLLTGVQRLDTRLPGAIRLQVPEGFTGLAPDPAVGRVEPRDPADAVVPAPPLRDDVDRIVEVLGTDALLDLLRTTLQEGGVEVSGPVLALLTVVAAPEKLRVDWPRYTGDAGLQLVLPGAGPRGRDVVVVLRAVEVDDGRSGAAVPSVSAWREVQQWTAREDVGRRTTEWSAGVTARAGRMETDSDGAMEHQVGLYAAHERDRVRGTSRQVGLRVRSGFRTTHRGARFEYRSRTVVWQVVAGPAGGVPVVRFAAVVAGLQYLHRTGGVETGPGGSSTPGRLSPMARTTALRARDGEGEAVLADEVTAMVAAVAPGLLVPAWRAKTATGPRGTTWTWSASRELPAPTRHALSLRRLALSAPTLLASGLVLALPAPPGSGRRRPLELLVTAERTGDFVRVGLGRDDETMPYHISFARRATATVRGGSRESGLELDHATYLPLVGSDEVSGQGGASAQRATVEEHVPQGEIEIHETKPGVDAPVVTHRGAVALTAELVDAPGGHHLGRRLGLPDVAGRWRTQGRTPPPRSVAVTADEEVVAPLPAHPQRVLRAGRSTVVRVPAAPPEGWTGIASGARRAAVLGVDGSALRAAAGAVAAAVLESAEAPAALRGLLRRPADARAALGTLLDPATVLGSTRALAAHELRTPLGFREGALRDTAGWARLGWSFGDGEVVGVSAGRVELEQWMVSEQSTVSTVRSSVVTALEGGGYALLAGPGTATPDSTTTRLAPDLRLHRGTERIQRGDHVVAHSRASAWSVGGPFVLVRASVRLTAVLHARRSTGAGAVRDVDPPATDPSTAFTVVHELPGAALLAVPLRQARELGLVPAGGTLTHTGLQFPPADPAAADPFVDVLPQFPGWQTAAVHLTPDGRVESGAAAPLTAEQFGDHVESLVRAGTLRRVLPVVLMPRGGATAAAPAFARALRARLGVAVVTTAGRVKITLDPALIATDADGPTPWWLLPERGADAALGYDLVAGLGARSHPGSRPPGAVGEILRRTAASTRVESTHHRDNVLLRPARLSREQVDAAVALPAFPGARMLIGWSDGGKVVVGDRRDGAAPATPTGDRLLDGEGLADWLDGRPELPRDRPLVLAVGGAAGIAEVVHRRSGREVVAPTGLWSRDARGELVTTRGEGSGARPPTWVRFRDGVRTELGPNLSAALTAQGYRPVPAPVTGVGADGVLAPSAPVGRALPPLSDLDRAVLGRAAAADLRAGGVDERLDPVGPDADVPADDAGGTVWEDAASELSGDPDDALRDDAFWDDEVWADAHPDPAVDTTHFGHVLRDDHLPARARRYAGRLPRAEGWTTLVAAATSDGRPLLDGEPLGADGVIDLLDALEVPAGTPVALVASRAAAVAAAVALRTGRLVLATEGTVHLSPDGRARAHVPTPAGGLVRHWWQLHRGGLPAQALAHDLETSLARWTTTVGPERAPIEEALAERPAPAPPTAAPGASGPDEAPAGMVWTAPGRLDAVAREHAVAPRAVLRQVTPQPPEPDELGPVEGTVYSADLLPDPGRALALGPGEVVAGGLASGVTDPAALPLDTRVVARISGVVGAGTGPGSVLLPPGAAYRVVAVEPDAMDPDMVRVDLVGVGPAGG